jgi:hypothetical protein
MEKFILDNLNYLFLIPIFLVLLTYILYAFKSADFLKLVTYIKSHINYFIFIILFFFFVRAIILYYSSLFTPLNLLNSFLLTISIIYTIILLRIFILDKTFVKIENAFLNDPVYVYYIDKKEKFYDNLTTRWSIYIIQKNKVKKFNFYGLKFLQIINKIEEFYNKKIFNIQIFNFVVLFCMVSYWIIINLFFLSMFFLIKTILFYFYVHFFINGIFRIGNLICRTGLKIESNLNELNKVLHNTKIESNFIVYYKGTLFLGFKLFKSPIVMASIVTGGFAFGTGVYTAHKYAETTIEKAHMKADMAIKQAEESTKQAVEATKKAQIEADVLKKQAEEATKQAVEATKKAQIEADALKKQAEEATKRAQIEANANTKRRWW